MGVPDDIRAACTGGQAAGGPYEEGGPGRVSVYRKGPVLYWTAGMTIDCDGQPGSACNINTDPYFQPQTAFTQSDGRPLKAEQLPYVVVPLASSRWDYKASGVRGGDLCVIAYRDKYVFAVVGDLGPSGRIGEASYAAAAALGINPNPRSGGVGSGVTYVVFPGVRVAPIESKSAAETAGAAHLSAWLGTGGPSPDPEPEEPRMSAIDKMVQAAEADLGLGEPNYIQDWYDREFGDLGYNWAWCNAAVTWWAHKSGNAKAVCFSDRGHFAYTVAHAQAFKDRGQWTYGTGGIRRGDIVFFDWNGQDSIAAIDHVGLVVDVKSDGIHTIEGNIENACRRKVRGAYEIAGYGRPAYIDGGTPSTPSPPIGGTVKLSDARAHTDAVTRVIQTALNREFGGVVVDGVYGPQTTAAYTRWQQSLGWPGDGQPGVDSLTKLGAKYGFAVDAGTAPAPQPEPEPEVPPVTYTPPPFPADLAPNRSNPSAKDLQRALKAVRLLAGSVELADNYGPKTQAAVAAFYNLASNADIRISSNDVAIGPKGWARLFTLAYAPKIAAPQPASNGAPPSTGTLAGLVCVASQVYPGAPDTTSVRIVQDALNREFGGVWVDGIYGPQTTAAYKRWQESLGFTGADADGVPGVTSLARLAEKYGFTVQGTPRSAAGGEPAHNYARTSWSGRTVNQRTKDMLSTAQAIAGFGFTVSQGSYNAGGVAASAGTHDGGGAVDIAAANLSGSARTTLVTALRKAGFAAWLRTPSEGPWGYHIHAVAIGDRELSSGAARQVQSYFNGRNALANNGPDTHPGGRPYPAWAGKYDQ